MNYQENIYWNERTYGSAIRIKKWTLRSIVVGLGIVVPVILPIPVMAFISRYIKNDLVLRYEK